MPETITKQLRLQRSIERSLENFKKIGKNNLTPAKIRSRISSLKEVWGLYQTGHDALIRITPVDTQATVEYFTTGQYEATEEVYNSSLDFMTEWLEELEPVVSHNQSVANFSAHSSNVSSFSSVHLPPIRLPPFDGSYEEWENFRDRFTSLILDNPELNNFARMHFLMSCLKGRALECISSISVTANNFEVAWTALTTRYENQRRLVNVHLSTLLNLPAVTRESASDLQALRDRVNVAVASLLKLKRSPADLWADILVHLVVLKLDPLTKKAWNLKAHDTDVPMSYDELSRFLTSRTRALEDCSTVGARKVDHKPTLSPRVHVATASIKTRVRCPLCQSSHFINLCPTFLNQNSEQRRDLVRKHKRCFNCLSDKHTVSDCLSKYSCRLCRKRHHSTLHAESDTSSTNSDELRTQIGTPHSNNLKSEVNSLLASIPPQARARVLLATACVNVSAPSGRSVMVRALLDQGSEMTFISQNLAQMLRATRIRMPISITAVGGIHAGTFRHAAQITLSSRFSDSQSYSITALILNSLTSYTPPRSDVPSLDYLADLPWADPDPTSSTPIDIIIGSDLYSEIIQNGIRKGQSGHPIAQNSVFGWVISRPTSSTSNSSQNETYDISATQISHHVMTHHVAITSSLNEEIRRFWEIEEIPIKQAISPDEEKCEEHFRSTHSRQSDGRYIVRLPFKHHPPIDIGQSRTKAATLLNYLLQRLNRKPDQSREYSDFLREYELLGHMSFVPRDQPTPPQVVYIPHHAVIRESSATTHCRVVFNASSRTSNGSSLNDHLYAGPKLQTDLLDVISSWRQHRYVYSADIEKMYRQIKVDSRDLAYQRILWHSPQTERVVEYQLQTVTYGFSCAPFLALRVLQQLNRDDGHQFPLAAPVLRQNIYVDDLLFGADDLETLRQIRSQLVALLSRGGFILRKWASNCSSLLSDIDESNHGLAITKLFEPDDRLKILGLSWNPFHDSFEFRVFPSESVPTTKRSILSVIARFYDPLGWVTPVTISAKIFIQQLWKLKTDWDEEIPIALSDNWKSFYASLSALNSVRIPRWNGFGADIRCAELHGFSDASTVAYAAVVYLKVVRDQGLGMITLLAGKSRVAPLTPLSVPRLELSAAVLLAKLMESVQRSLGLANIPCYCWTDSTIVHTWVTQHPSRWKVFISNRVADIQSRVPTAIWGHVSTTSNPADCASRGLLGTEILTNPLWWTGPTWLQHSQDEWPSTPFTLPSDAPLEEKLCALQCSRSADPWELATRYSSWPKLVRVTAYILKFVGLCRRKEGNTQFPVSKSRVLSSAECAAAKTFWIRQMQADLYTSEIYALKNKHSVSSKSSLLTLHPYLDHDNILRVGGRINKAPVPFSVRHPIILASHPILRMIVSQAHLRALHAGPQLTLNILRRDFWIIRARSIVKAVIHSCVPCTRERAAIPSQLMGELPEERVSSSHRCFVHCGIDYAGPVQVRASAGRGIKSRKAYIALFICLATKAIHLELVGDYSTAAFLNAFSRFCSRRGLPQKMYSDNGTTFVGADRELKLAYQKSLHDPTFLNSTATDGITWKFIPPSAAHFGGLWEAGVRSVKHHLRRVIGRHTLTYEEFSTLLCQIEACLNSRPLAPLSDTIDDYETLTPGHFLIGSALVTHPEPSTLHLNENRLSRWQLVRHIFEKIWRIWQNDYVNTLQQRFKWSKRKDEIQTGQLVLLRNNNLPPCKWELGRVSQCHPGADGLVRVVTVKTATSEYKRPIVKLCILPVQSEVHSV